MSRSIRDRSGRSRSPRGGRRLGASAIPRSIRPDLENFFRTPESLSFLKKLRHDLLDFENSQNFTLCQDDEGFRSSWRLKKSLMASKVKEGLRFLLKDSGISSVEPADVARELGCCILQARSSKGRDIETQNAEYSLQNHKDMISDRVRVDAFWDAIRRAIRRDVRVLDVGSGAFSFLSRVALAAGAREVHAVEVNFLAWKHAVQLLKTEAEILQDLKGDASDAISASLQSISKELRLHRLFPLIGNVQTKELQTEGLEPTYELILLNKNRERVLKLVTKCAASFSATLEGPYDVVIHELLGHIASSEGVVETIHDLVRRGICDPSKCVFVPRAAGTLFAPTARLQLSDLEKVLNANFNGEVGIRSNLLYHARCFDSRNFLAQPQPFEWLEFGESHRTTRRVTFVTEKDGFFDGLHFHLLVQLDDFTSIDTLQSETTWSTTYVRLEDSFWLPVGTRMVCDCEAKCSTRQSQGPSQPDRRIRCFSVQVHIGEPWDERHVASFSWEGTA